MMVNFDYGELLTISCALHTLDIVYGPTDVRDRVMEKVDEIMVMMNSLPIDQIYPNIEAALADVEV